jgi:hypothetical protein
MYKKEKSNDAIERELNDQLVNKGINIRKIFIQRDGNRFHGEFNRTINLIERIPRRLVEDGNFGIENCWAFVSVYHPFIFWWKFVAQNTLILLVIL